MNAPTKLCATTFNLPDALGAKELTFKYRVKDSRRQNINILKTHARASIQKHMHKDFQGQSNKIQRPIMTSSYDVQ